MSIKPGSIKFLSAFVLFTANVYLIPSRCDPSLPQESEEHRQKADLSSPVKIAQGGASASPPPLQNSSPPGLKDVPPPSQTEDPQLKVTPPQMDPNTQVEEGFNPPPPQTGTPNTQPQQQFNPPSPQMTPNTQPQQQSNPPSPQMTPNTQPQQQFNSPSPQMTPNTQPQQQFNPPSPKMEPNTQPQQQSNPPSPQIELNTQPQQQFNPPSPQMKTPSVQQKTKSSPKVSNPPSQVTLPQPELPIVQKRKKNVIEDDEIFIDEMEEDEEQGLFVRSLGYDYLILEGEEEFLSERDNDIAADEDDDDQAIEEEEVVSEHDDDVVVEIEEREEEITPWVAEKQEEPVIEQIAPVVVEKREEIVPERKEQVVEGPFFREIGHDYLVLEDMSELEEENEIAALEELIAEHEDEIALEEVEEISEEENHLALLSDEDLVSEEIVESDRESQIKAKNRSLLGSMITKPYRGLGLEKKAEPDPESQSKVQLVGEKKVAARSETQEKAKAKPSLRSIITKPLQHYSEAWSLLTPYFQQPLSFKGIVTHVEKGMDQGSESISQEPTPSEYSDLLLAEAEEPLAAQEESLPQAALAADPLPKISPPPTPPVKRATRRSVGEKWNNYPVPKRMSAYGVVGEGPMNVDSYFALQTMFAPEYPAYSVVPLVEATGFYFVDNTYGATLGVGGRYLPEWFPALIGFNAVGAYYQGQQGPLFQCGLGLEMIAKRWGFYAHGFIPVGNQVNINRHSFNKIGNGYKASCTQIESTFTGFISQASLLAYQGGDFFLYLSAGPYFFANSHGGQTFWGGQFMIQPRYNDILSIALTVNYDHFLGTTVQGEFILSFPFYSLSRLKKYKGYRSDRWINRQVYQPFYRSGPLPVDRECCWKSNF